MKRRPRRNHTPAFKAKVALAAIKGERTLVQLSEHFDIHVNQITSWKDQLLQGAVDVFGAGTKPSAPEVDIKLLHARRLICGGAVRLHLRGLHGPVRSHRTRQFPCCA
jgi:transposase